MSNSSTPPWKHVWITGASSGLGEHVARALAKRGCIVSITARREEQLAAIAADFDHMFIYPADVTDAEALKLVVAQMEEQHGPVDLTIFGAGASFSSSATELEIGNFAKTLDINVMGVTNALDAVLPHMLARRAGHISWIASVAGYGGLPISPPYGASKAALINMAESMHGKLKQSGVTLSLINPGFVRTPMTDVNTFPMPFLMEPEAAAEKMIAGLRRKKFEITFPWQLVWILKVLNLLPYWLYLPIIRRVI